MVNMKTKLVSMIFGMGGSVLLGLFLIIAGCVSDSNQVKTSLQQPAGTTEVKQSAADPSNSYWKHPVPSGAEDRTPTLQNSDPAEENSPTDSASEKGSDDSLDDKEVSASILPGKKKRSDQELLDSALEFCQVSNDFWDKGDLDNALEALDEAYALILKVNTEKSSDILQQRDDLRFTISKRIMEVYASRFIVANGLHTAIPLDMNDHVKKAINLFQGRERDNFLNAYRRSGRYRPAILKALKEAGLPEELSWLPLIESGFKVRALSSARALGLWQFIASTGYRYGVNRDRWVDERMDPEKSTAAAIAYLKDLHQIFGDWYTVLAAYNCGEGRVLRCIKTQRINYLDHFWDLYAKLPSETAFYVPKFLAVLHILNDPAAYGFVLPPVDKEILTDVVVTERQVSLRVMAEQIDVPYQELRDLNPDLRYSSTPPNEYSFRVPKEKETLLASVFEKLPEWHPPVPDCVVHRVRKGETLSGISKKYRTSVGAIKALNGLHSTRYLKVGWNLKIPAGKQYVSSEQTISPSPQRRIAEKRPEMYVVRNGDSLWTIANRFETTTKAIMSLNRLGSARLSIGQQLKIPKTSSGDVQISSCRQVVAAGYTVIKGDSPYTIAHKHGLSVEDLLRMNGLNSSSTIFPGQVLTVKAR